MYPLFILWFLATTTHQHKTGDGIAGRGPSYGIATIRVDGGDAVAVYNATKEAKRLALETTSPILIEAMSYRSGHHSTSDDSSRYRAAEEMRMWRARDPVTRFQAWMMNQGWWTDKDEAELRQTARRRVITALEQASGVEKNAVSEMFDDVYDELPGHLRQQREEVLEFLKKYPENIPPQMPL